MYFVVGVNTGVGKTFFTTKVIERKGCDVFAVKPIISGYNSDDELSDTALICKALQGHHPRVTHNDVSYYMLSLPLSPNIAANIDGIEVWYEKIFSFIEGVSEKFASDILLVEGAGGVASPINDQKLMGDLAFDLQERYGSRTILVVNNELGVISQTVTAVSFLKLLGVKEVEVVFNAVKPSEYDDEVIITIQRLCGCKIVRLDKFIESID